MKMIDTFKNALIIFILVVILIFLFNALNEKKKLFTMAVTDSLTGLHNRYYLSEISRKKLSKSKRYNYPISVVYMDIDYFKKINDTYGHDVGDLILKHFASHLKNSARKRDIVFRLGGEEFFILMPFINKKDACSIIKDIKESLKDGDRCISIDGEKIYYTFSAGIADTTETGFNLNNLMKVADERLYKAKITGRDRVIC